MLLSPGGQGFSQKPARGGARGHTAPRGSAAGSFVLARLVHRGIGQAQHDPPEHAQHQGRVGGSHPVEVHGDVQAVMESAFNDPVAPFELEHSPDLQLLQRQAAEQEHHFSSPFAHELIICWLGL